MPPIRVKNSFGPYLVAFAIVLATFAVVGLLQSTLVELPSAILLYLVPIVLAASRWGRGPAITTAVLSLLGHDLLFIEPRGTFNVARVDEALGLVLLLFTALVTAQLADGARRGAETAREAAVVRRSDELKTAILRAVTHNLRTPLASIKASVSGLRQPEAAYSDADREELLAEIEEEADRLDRLVNNLLDASRLEGGGLRPSAHPQDLRELVYAVVARLQPRMPDRPVSIDMADDLPAVACDYAQIDQVVTNLIENAHIHTPPGTPIALQARLEGDVVRVAVVDNGPGIPESDRERLFRAFERGQTRAPGTGLGLTIARGFVEAHGGHLWLEDAPERGARFVFTLPAA
ncbi:MAG TPA: ATP-binding protein [Chloroflexota bacterium]|jgi:two-component system sensor histidine kinase KdpD